MIKGTSQSTTFYLCEDFADHFPHSHPTKSFLSNMVSSRSRKAAPAAAAKQSIRDSYFCFWCCFFGCYHDSQSSGRLNKTTRMFTYQSEWIEVLRSAVCNSFSFSSSSPTSTCSYSSLHAENAENPNQLLSIAPVDREAAHSTDVLSKCAVQNSDSVNV